MNFSQRRGLEEKKKILQIDNVDKDLRTSLWNALHEFFWSRIDSYISQSSIMEVLINNLWKDFLKVPLDELRDFWESTQIVLKDYFFSCPWNKVYDFVEFVAADNANRGIRRQNFMQRCNVILERESSAYRFVGGHIIEISSEEEIAEIERVLDESDDWVIVKTHIMAALAKLRDKKAPDYRNSIKESISAVEAACQKIAKDPKATLGDALKQIENEKATLHPSLKLAFTQLYGYTSDAEGIRHALKGKSELDAIDARFMLIACSAFVNYLISKVS